MTVGVLWLLIGGILWAVAALFWLTWRWSAPAQQSQYESDSIKTVSVDGFDIKYLRRGSGPDLVLVHGLGADLHCWRLLIPFLEKAFTVTALDLPGFGGSTKLINADYGLDAQAARLEAFAEALGVTHGCWVGNSMGGNICLWLAASRPDLVRKVAVIAPATSPRLAPISARRFLWAATPASFFLTRLGMRMAHRYVVSRGGVIDKSRVEETFRTYARQPPAVRTFLLATDSIRDSRLPKELERVKSPVLVLWGSRDRVVSRNVIDELTAAIPHSESHVNLLGGHHLQEDDPDWVSEHLVSFFTRDQD